MRRSIATCAVWTALLLALAAARPALSETFDDIRVVHIAGATASNTSHGYAEHRFHVTNRSTSHDHAVTLVMPANSYGGGYHVRRMSRSVTVRAGASAEVSLWQPAVSMNGSGVAVYIDGRQHRDRLHANIDGHGQMSHYYSGGYGGVATRCLLVSRDVSPHFINNASTGLTAASHVAAASASHGRHHATSAGANFESARSEVSIENWSTNWLGYSRYDLVVVSAADMGKASASVGAALWQYVEAGGALMVAGAWKPTLPASSARRSEDDPFSDQGFFTVYDAGFGVCLVTDKNDGGQRWTGDAWGTLRQAIEQTVRPFDNIRSPAKANDAFPVVDDLSIPARGLFVLMLLFAIVIGPVNMLVLRRKKRKILLLATVPALSILAAVGLFIYALLAEGIYGYARVSSLTLLDERQHRATTLGWSAFYSPLTPSSGLRYAADTELTPQYGNEYGYYRDTGHAVTLDWTAGQHLSAGWVPARVPVHFAMRRSETRRERLEVHRADDGSVKAVNGLGATIKQLWLADADGTVWTHAEIAPGAAVTLERGPSADATLSPISLRKFYVGGDWFRAPGDVTSAWRNYLSPNGYVALLEGAPFVDPGLESAEHRTDTSVVVGILREPFVAARALTGAVADIQPQR